MSGIDPERLQQAILDPRWAVLARADLDISAIGTWNPQLPRDTRLLVPIDVQALVVPAAGGVRAVPTETVLRTPAPGDGLREAGPVPPAPFGDPADRAAGIHLHFAMPDGLTRGDAGAARSEAAPPGGATRLPQLPDRWVVVRLLHGTGEVRSWVLEADRGDHHDLSGWTEHGPLPPGTVAGASGRRYFPRETLTAVAGGEPAWAATYDAVVDRFAFHDDLADLGTAAAGRASYLVAGWWSDPALDPLHDVTTLGAYTARAAALGWLAPEPAGLSETAQERSASRLRWNPLELVTPQPLGSGVAAKADGREVDLTTVRADLVADTHLVLGGLGPSAPRQTLLHGLVLGVPLDGAGPDLIPDAASLELALGPTPFGALAALLADGTDEERDASERLLAAFTSGLVATIDSPGGLATADESRHAGGFVAVDGGVRAKPDRIAEGDPLTPAGTTAPAAATGPTARAPGFAILRRRDEFQVVRDAILSRFGHAPSRDRTPRSFRDVVVPEPRYFHPADLAFVVRGAVRSWRHGGDRRFTPQGLLACRLPSQVVSAHDGVLDGGDLPPGLRTVSSGAVPPEVDLLLREAVLTDPYRVGELAAWSAERRGHPPEAVKTRLDAEMVLRYRFDPADGVLTDEVRDDLRRASLTLGEDMSPVGWTRWSQPWVPLWCDWELAVRLDDGLERWRLGEVDLAPRDAAHADAPGERVVRGRTLVASSSARGLAAQIRGWLDEENRRDLAGQGQLSEGSEAELAAAADAAGGADLLTGSFRGLRETLLGLDPVEATMVQIDETGKTLTRPLQVALPLLLAGGAATLKRLRVVDAFGRWVDAPDDVLARLEVAATNRHADGPPKLTLPPRFQRPVRLRLRLVDPRTADGDPEVEARIDQEHPDQAVSPVAGWLLPDHVDEALEFFDASGSPLGQLLHDPLTDAVVWEGAPGRPGPIGGPPDPGGDPGARHATRLAVGLLQADARVRNDPATPKDQESALSALLRVVDTTLWTVDPLGSLGTATVAGLVGRPIAIVRAVLRLDVLDDLDALDYADQAARDGRRRAYDELVARAVAARLGELTRTDDGLLAYAVDDDYAVVHAVAPEILAQARASGRLRGQLSVFARGSEQPPELVPITHPYISTQSEVPVRPGQSVRLTLLLAPGGKVHATCGVVPRKSVALARDWFHRALEVLSPSFRIGPVLVDPTTVRMPKVTGLGDKQVFTRRDTPLTWRDDPILAASQAALLPDLPSGVQEGWIRVSHPDSTQ